MSLHPTRRPFEARVIAEKSELDVRLFSLEQFFLSDQFTKVDEPEQWRLKRQFTAMAEYAKILGERIAAFTPVEPVTNLDNPGPRGHEKSIPVTELNPELAGTALFKEEVPIGAKPIEDIDTFAMMVDQWHGKCMEQGNRLLEIPEGTEVTVENHAEPGKVIQMNLDGPYLHVFRVGVESALNVFKDLPFGASLEDAPQ
jgi:hypothetical protein